MIDILAKKIIARAAKILVAIACMAFIYAELFTRNKFDLIWQQFQKSFTGPVDYFYLFAVIILMFFNWGIETYKWKFLLKKIEHISFFTALKSVLAGVSISLFTPNRVGEFGGRILFLDTGHRIKAIFISIIGSLSQLCITIIIGSLAYAVYSLRHYELNEIECYLIVILAFVTAFVSGLVFYNIDLLRSLLTKLKILRKYRVYLNVFTYYNSVELTRVLLISFFRYLVFSLQYYFLLRLFDINISLAPAMLTISVVFLVLAIIPTVALAELGIRGAVAAAFFSVYAANQLSIIATSSLLWFINLVIPALVGLVFISYATVFKDDPQSKS